jgi:hypothetical protein
MSGLRAEQFNVERQAKSALGALQYRLNCYE